MLRVKDLVERYVAEGPVPLDRLMRPVVQRRRDDLPADRVDRRAARAPRALGDRRRTRAGAAVGLITIQDVLGELLGAPRRRWPRRRATGTLGVRPWLVSASAALILAERAVRRRGVRADRVAAAVARAPRVARRPLRRRDPAHAAPRRSGRTDTSRPRSSASRSPASASACTASTRWPRSSSAGSAAVAVARARAALASDARARRCSRSRTSSSARWCRRASRCSIPMRVARFTRLADARDADRALSGRARCRTRIARLVPAAGRHPPAGERARADLHAGGTAAHRRGERARRRAAGATRAGSCASCSSSAISRPAQVMVPRVRVVGIPVGATPDELRRIVVAAPPHALPRLRRRPRSHRRHAAREGSAAAR